MAQQLAAPHNQQRNVQQAHPQASTSAAQTPDPSSAKHPAIGPMDKVLAHPVDGNAAQVGALLAPHMEGLMQAAHNGKLTQHQVQQLRQLAQVYGPAIQQFKQQQEQRQRAAAEEALKQQLRFPSGAQNPPDIRQLQLQKQMKLSIPPNAGNGDARGSPAPQSTPNSGAGNQTESPGLLSVPPSLLLKGTNSHTLPMPTPWSFAHHAPPPPVAGVKRKTPPMSTPTGSNALPSNTVLYPQGSQPTQQQLSTRPQQSNSSTLAVSSPETNEESTEPGPQSWPNLIGSRPTLTGGLGGSSVLLSTPTYLIHPQMDTEALETPTALEQNSSSSESAANTLQKDGKNGNSAVGHGPKKTVKEIIASVDPNVRVEADVENFMLELADEFIDAATHFACQLALHRGSDTLDVRDLQLHLESNLNLRIPGFSSDETRVAISHSSNGADLSIGTRAGKGGNPKPSKIPKTEKGKSSESKDADTRLGRGMRSARLAAARAAKKV